MHQIAKTLKPPYYAVIFTSLRIEADDGYRAAAEKMVALASQQPGFLGVESVREPGGLGITVSYWKDEASIENWKNHAAHRRVQQFGRDKWYSSYSVRVAKVVKEYGQG